MTKANLKIRIWVRFITILFIQIISSNSFSQDLLNNRNISQVKVDQLSDSEIVKFQQQLKASGLSSTEASQIALSRGMSPSEVSKLKNRVDNINNNLNNYPFNNITGNNNQNDNNGSNVRKYVPITDQTIENLNYINPKIFGSELFRSNSLSFEPNLHMATPLNYILGAGDAILINVYGLQEVSFNQTVSPEGTIYIPTVGVINVGGMKIEQATQYLKARMARIGYKSLNTGASKLSVSLSKIRSISISIIGANKSGSYTLSSLSTLFNALYLAGGPAVNRSFRKIELIRDNKVYKVVDLYGFLLRGDESDNVSLRDNDVIRLPIYETRVEIEGEVKRPGIFELLKDEKLSDLLKYTSGFSDSAYRASIKVIQLTNKDKKVLDLDEDKFSIYTPKTGDYFEVSKILNRFENRVTITGAVFRPGIFEITPDLTVSKLIKNAEGLKEDAFTERGQIFRLKDDNSNEIISFDVSKILSGGVNDIKLKREDSVIISSIFDLRDKYNLTIQGEIRKPGTFDYNEGITLKDLIQQAGGFTYVAYPQRIEVARLIKRDTLTSRDTRLSEIINIQDLNDLSVNNKNLLLQPFDVVTIRRNPGFIKLESVQINGQIQFPGYYVLSNRLEKVSDLLKRAGGFSPEAFPEGAYLKRLNPVDSNKLINDTRIATIQKKLKDSTGDIVNSVSRPYDQIPLDLNNILANPKSEYNLILKAGDEIYIPRNDQEIKISGEVFFPTQAPYLKGNRLKDYISSAGGFTENARRKKVYIVYANGKAVATRHFSFIYKYPVVKPGAEIIVPKANSKRKANTAETIAISGAIASLTYVLISIIQLIKK